MTACPICAGHRFAPLYTAATDYITGDSFTVLRCADCGYGHLLPVPADLGRYYPARYRAYNLIILKILDIFYERRVRQWIARFPAPGRAFEIGCGGGLMLRALAAHGWNATGSERTPEMAAQAAQFSGAEVLVGGIEATAPDARFDLILLNHVLEHLEDPVPMLRAIRARLAPGGQLIIGVPNFASWQARFGGAKWFHLDVPRHVHHFTPKALGVLLGTCGIEIESISFVSPEHDPYGWVQGGLNHLDGRHNRLTRQLMRLDPFDMAGIGHLALGCVFGALAIPVSLASWAAGSGAIMELTCR